MTLVAALGHGEIHVMVQFLNWINFIFKLVQYFLNWFIFLNQFEIFKLVSFFPMPMFLETITQYDLSHCQKFGTRWRLRVRTKAIMAAKSYKKMYGNKETFSNISIMSLRVFGARLETC